MQYEELGTWWFTDDEDTKFSGELKICEDSKVLIEINYPCKIINLNNFYDKMMRRSINGIDKNGNDVSLFGATNIAIDDIFDDKIKINFRYFVIGNHFNSIDEICIKECKVECNDLQLFLAKKISITINSETKKFSSKFILSEFDLTIDTELNDKNDFITQLEFAFQNLQSINSFIDYLYKLDLLFAMFIRTQIRFNVIKIKSEKEIKIYIADLNELTDYKKVSEFKKNYIEFYDIECDFENILICWFSKYNGLMMPVSFLLNSLIENKKVFLEVSFLMLAQALEAFQRAFRTNKQNNKERILELLNDICVLVDLSGEFIEKLATKTKDTRNYYTHYSDSNTHDIFREDLYEAFRLLQALLNILILQEIGVDNILFSQKVLLVEEFKENLSKIAL